MYMLSYNLTCIHLIAWINEELTTVLQLINRISVCRTILKGNHRTGNTPCNVSLVGLIFLKTMSHDSLTL